MSKKIVVLDEDEARRHDAGEDFELAADMNAPLPFVPLEYPQVFFAFGLMIFICILTIIELVCAHFFYYYFGYFFFTILVGCAIFLPDVLDTWWHWIIQAGYWCIYAIANILFFIVYIVKYNEAHEDFQKANAQKQLKDLENEFNWVIAYTCIAQPVLMAIAFLMVRMGVHGYQNRP